MLVRAAWSFLRVLALTWLIQRNVWPLINLEENITLRTHLEMYGVFFFFFFFLQHVVESQLLVLPFIFCCICCPTAIKNKQAKIVMSLTHVVFEKNRPNTTQWFSSLCMCLYVVIDDINTPNMRVLIFHFKMPLLDLKIKNKRLKRLYEVNFPCGIAIIMTAVSRKHFFFHLSTFIETPPSLPFQSLASFVHV